MEEGKIDGLTLVFDQNRNAWVQLGHVPELKQVMHQLMEEEEQRVTLENKVAESDQVFAEDPSIPVIPDEMKQAGASRGTKRSFQADNGKHFVWDDAENDWVEDENPSSSGESEDEDAHQKQGKNGDSKKVVGATSAEVGGGEGDVAQDEKAAARKKKKKKKKATWNDNASGLWIYVTGLPSDVTAEELKSHFSKVMHFLSYFVELYDNVMCVSGWLDRHQPYRPTTENKNISEPGWQHKRRLLNML